ncbi:MAG: AAA family ATPase [Candidatus Bathyarchaeota archaeon]|nr:AAA family ATPase [Candidatus Termiticorpusculum sp.]
MPIAENEQITVTVGAGFAAFNNVLQLYSLFTVPQDTVFTNLLVDFSSVSPSSGFVNFTIRNQSTSHTYATFTQDLSLFEAPPINFGIRSMVPSDIDGVNISFLGDNRYQIKAGTYVFMLEPDLTGQQAEIFTAVLIDDEIEVTPPIDCPVCTPCDNKWKIIAIFLLMLAFLTIVLGVATKRW